MHVVQSDRIRAARDDAWVGETLGAAEFDAELKRGGEHPLAHAPTRCTPAHLHGVPHRARAHGGGAAHQGLLGRRLAQSERLRIAVRRLRHMLLGCGIEHRAQQRVDLWVVLWSVE